MSAHHDAFPPNLLFPSSLTQNTSSQPLVIQQANEILKAAMRPVEIPQNRQHNWTGLSHERHQLRTSTPSPFNDQTRALLNAAALVASATNTHLLYKAVSKHGAAMFDNRPNRVENDDRSTQVHLYLVDPLDDNQLISETSPLVFQIGQGIIGHVAKTKTVLNMAIGDLPDHPTNHLNPRKPDDAFNPDEFWMSYEGDPTRDVLCVPIFNETLPQNDEADSTVLPSPSLHQPILGVLHAQRPSLRAHFRRVKSRQGGRRGRSKTPQKKNSNNNSNQNNVLEQHNEQNEQDAVKRKQRQQELSAKNRAREAPYQLISEEAFVQLGRLVAAAVLQSNADDGENFAKQARKFRAQKNMKRVFKVLERGTREAKLQRLRVVEHNLAQSKETNQQLVLQLQNEHIQQQQLKEAMLAAQQEKVQNESRHKQTTRELDLLKATTKLTAIETSQLTAKMLSMARRNAMLEEELEEHRAPDDVAEIRRLVQLIETNRRTQANVEEEERERKKKRIMMRIVMRTAAIAFRSWSVTVKEIARQKEQLRRMMLRVMNRALAVRWDAWMEFVEEAQRLKEMLNKAARKMKNRQVSGAFESWIEYVDLRFFMKNFVSKMIGRYEKKEIAKGMNKWMSVFNEARRSEMEGENGRRGRSSFCDVQ